MRRNVPIRREQEIRAYLSSLKSAGRLQGVASDQASDDYLELDLNALAEFLPRKAPCNPLSPKAAKQVKRRQKKQRSMSRQGMEGGSNA